MARIEISLEEYNSLKNKKKELESVIGKQKQEIANLKEKNEEYKDLLEEVRNLKIFERALHWKDTMNEINDLLK